MRSGLLEGELSEVERELGPPYHFPDHLMQHYLYQYATDLGISWEDFLSLGKLRADDPNETFSMSNLAIRLSQRVNGVSKLHGLVSHAHVSLHLLWGHKAHRAIASGGRLSLGSASPQRLEAHELADWRSAKTGPLRDTLCVALISLAERRAPGSRPRTPHDRNR